VANRWRTAALVLLALLGGAALWGKAQMDERRAVENELSARYQQAFFDAVGRVENVEVLLSKGIIASSPRRIAEVFSDVRLEALAAQASLTQLPLVPGALLETSKFLSQVGDFGFTLAKKAAAGSPPDQDELDLLQRLRQEAAQIAAQLHQIQKEAAQGRMPWGELRARSNARLNPGEGGGARFQDIEEQVQRIPAIQYDGPFSDHVLSREPKGLTGDVISEERAEEVAMEFLPRERKAGYRAQVRRRVEGRIPAFSVTASSEQGGAEVVMDVAEKGGHVVWMLTKREVARTRMSVEEAVEIARNFLEERGFESMEPTYVSTAENVAVIPFVWVKDGVRIYPDQVKVSVALDDGEVVGFEAMAYLTAHTGRELPRPKISREQAHDRVAPGLEVNGEVRLALIPLPSGEEALAWEVPARMGEDWFLVYVNALTGEEENILRLVETGEGAMTL